MITANGAVVNTLRWFASWSGVWTAELDYESEIPLAGKVAIVSTEGVALNGTIDTDRSGKFGEKSFARVLGGGGGWAKPVRAQHYHSDVGVNLAVVVSTTAAEAGEVATVLIPKVLGPDFVRRKGSAAQVFADAGVDWWVGLDGVTRVGMRVPVPADPTSVQVLDWRPEDGAVTFSAEQLVEPGTLLVDIRFGTKIVKQVEATISGGTVTGTLWVADAPADLGKSVSELGDALAALARDATRAEFGRLYEYVVIAMAGDRVELVPLNRADGMPDLLPASVWGGISGYKATLTPGTRALVGFINGDPKRPFVAFYEPPDNDAWRPAILNFDALTLIILGAAATALPIARAPAIVAYATALKAAIDVATAAANAFGGSPVTGTQLGGILGAISTSLGSAGTTLAADCPSKKAVAS